MNEDTQVKQPQDHEMEPMNWPMVWIMIGLLASPLIEWVLRR